MAWALPPWRAGGPQAHRESGVLRHNTQAAPFGLCERLSWGVHVTRSFTVRPRGWRWLRGERGEQPTRVPRFVSQQHGLLAGGAQETRAAAQRSVAPGAALCSRRLNTALGRGPGDHPLT